MKTLMRKVGASETQTEPAKEDEEKEPKKIRSRPLFTVKVRDLLILYLWCVWEIPDVLLGHLKNIFYNQV